MASTTSLLPKPFPNLLLHYLAILILPINSIFRRLMPAFLTPSFMRTPASSFEPSDGAECTVCLCSIEQGEKISNLKCQHHFHKLCLDRWLQHQGRTCPICRDHLYVDKEVKRGSRLVVIHGAVDSIIISPFGDPGLEDTWWIW